jgi:hypothetical protein
MESLKRRKFIGLGLTAASVVTFGGIAGSPLEVFSSASSGAGSLQNLAFIILNIMLPISKM